MSTQTVTTNIKCLCLTHFYSKCIHTQSHIGAHAYTTHHHKTTHKSHGITESIIKHLPQKIQHIAMRMCIRTECTSSFYYIKNSNFVSFIADRLFFHYNMNQLTDLKNYRKERKETKRNERKCKPTIEKWIYGIQMDAWLFGFYCIALYNQYAQAAKQRHRCADSICEAFNSNSNSTFII